MTDDPKDPKRPVEIPEKQPPDSLPDVPERPIEEPGPDVTPAPEEEIPAKMRVDGASLADRRG